MWTTWTLYFPTENGLDSRAEPDCAWRYLRCRCVRAVFRPHISYAQHAFPRRCSLSSLPHSSQSQTAATPRLPSVRSEDYCALHFGQQSMVHQSPSSYGCQCPTAVELTQRMHGCRVTGMMQLEFNARSTTGSMLASSSNSDLVVWDVTQVRVTLCSCVSLARGSFSQVHCPFVCRARRNVRSRHPRRR